MDNNEVKYEDVKNAEMNNDPHHVLPVVIKWKEPKPRCIDSSSKTLRSYGINLI